MAVRNETGTVVRSGRAVRFCEQIYALDAFFGGSPVRPGLRLASISVNQRFQVRLPLIWEPLIHANMVVRIRFETVRASRSSNLRMEMGTAFSEALTLQLSCRAGWRDVEPRNAVMPARSSAAPGSAACSSTFLQTSLQPAKTQRHQCDHCHDANHLPLNDWTDTSSHSFSRVVATVQQIWEQ